MPTQGVWDPRASGDLDASTQKDSREALAGWHESFHCA